VHHRHVYHTNTPILSRPTPAKFLPTHTSISHLARPLPPFPLPCLRLVSQFPQTVLPPPLLDLYHLHARVHHAWVRLPVSRLAETEPEPFDRPTKREASLSPRQCPFSRFFQSPPFLFVISVLISVFFCFLLVNPTLPLIPSQPASFPSCLQSSSTAYLPMPYPH